jgi:hypothetical protein
MEKLMFGDATWKSKWENHQQADSNNDDETIILTTYKFIAKLTKPAFHS